ncbi:hypothetical protein GYMLUDRAFT_39595 [Collybiopsis luxurians FD-317 M1]|nr:hypothetical protein GYMLUDRAFT_39595 [Collybiopsis luxurians FD-317 M1]
MQRIPPNSNGAIPSSHTRTHTASSSESAPPKKYTKNSTTAQQSNPTVSPAPAPALHPHRTT